MDKQATKHSLVTVPDFVSQAVAIFTCDESSPKVMHIYIAQRHKVRNRTYFNNSRLEYKSGEQQLVCVVEWWKHKGVRPKWTLRGPDGNEIKFKVHPVPEGSNMSWENFPPEKQVPGEWVCEITLKGKVILEHKFTLTE